MTSSGDRMRSRRCGEEANTQRVCRSKRRCLRVAVAAMCANDGAHSAPGPQEVVDEAYKSEADEEDQFDSDFNDSEVCGCLRGHRVPDLPP